jgi:hypothetical protein
VGSDARSGCRWKRPRWSDSTAAARDRSPRPTGPAGRIAVERAIGPFGPSGFGRTTRPVYDWAGGQLLVEVDEVGRGLARLPA